MNLKERILTISLIEKIEKMPECATQLGLEVDKENKDYDDYEEAEEYWHDYN